jgi:hypothetical protein
VLDASALATPSTQQQHSPSDLERMSTKKIDNDLVVMETDLASLLPFPSSPSLSTTFLQVPSVSSSVRSVSKVEIALVLNPLVKQNEQSLFNASSIIIKK